MTSSIALSSTLPALGAVVAGAAVLCVIAAVTLWQNKYQRIWQQSQARDWERVDGKSDEGEVIVMRKGKSDVIAGYEVWIGYEYQYEGEQGDFYRSKEMPTREEAESLLKRLANRSIVVRVHPRKPSKSRVVDEDLTTIGIGPV